MARDADAAGTRAGHFVRYRDAVVVRAAAAVRGAMHWAGRRRFGYVRETLINEPVVRITDEAGCNFQIDVGI
ncbi:hypothetical protein C6T53_21210, partial [Burkholderia multivorans]